MLSLYSLVDNPIFERHYSFDLNCPLHFHTQVELVYILSGEIEVEIHGTKELLHENNLAIIFPNTIHKYQTLNQSEVLILIFTPTLVHNFFDTFQSYFPVFPFIFSDNISDDIFYVMNCIKQWDNFYPHPESVDLNLIRIYLSMVLYHIFNRISLDKLKVNDMDNQIHKFITFLLNHFCEQITLDHIAKEFGYSRYYVSRIFTKKIGCSFNVYLTSLRIEFAQNLLQNSDLNIDEVWIKSGFSSQSSFYRCFKEFSDLSPNQYRKNLYVRK